MDKENPIDTLDPNNQSADDFAQDDAKTKLAKRVQELFKSAYEALQQTDEFQRMAKCDDYKHGRQNPQQREDHPGSVTNIIHPIIESQIADLVDKPYNVAAEGWEPSDDLFADEARHLLEFVLYRNKFKVKLNVSEHDRLELGTTVLKVFYDEEGLDGKGLPTFEPISPANFYHDPKVTASHLLQEGEFCIHAVPRPLSYFRKKWPELGKYVKREVSVPYNPEDTFTNAKSDEATLVTSQKALLLEAYLKDDDGEVYCVHVANYLVLEDSREVLKGKRLQRRNQYPFVMIPCYVQRGTARGQSDVELLMPTQDLINELDDQIRMAARLMGNPQIAVGMGAGKGFDFRKWTNAPGLRVPMRDHNAFKVVEGSKVSSDIPNRREKAFQEADLISGRPDVNRGEKPGQVVAAAAIMALQQAGQKGVLHKAEMFKWGWAEVLELLFDEVLEHWDTEMWVRVNGDKTEYKWSDPSKLRQVPIMIPNESPMPGEDSVKILRDLEPIMGDDGNPMLDDEGNEMMREGKEMTRDAQFDFKLTMGNGLPSDTAFIYQTLAEWVGKVVEGKPVIGWSEIRSFLRDRIGLTLDSDDKFLQPPMPGQQPMIPGQPPIDPAMMNQVVNMNRGGVPA